MLVIKVRIQERPARIANREDPDQIASLEAVWSGSALFDQLQQNVKTVTIY